jgi:hypothetical protein
VLGSEKNTFHHLHVVDAVMSYGGFNTAPITANKALISTDPKMMAVAVGAAADDSAKKLDQIYDARVALTAQVLKAPDDGPSNTRGQILEAGGMLGLGFLSGPSSSVAPPSPGYTANTASYMPQHAGLGHAGLQHAALSSGTSFKSAPSSDEDKSSRYVDSMGDGWTWGGVAAPAPQLQFTNPQNTQFNAKLLEGAETTVKAHGKEKTLEDLQVITRSEERLLEQSNAAQEIAWDRYGVEMPQLTIKKPSLTGPKPFGGFFG